MNKLCLVLLALAGGVLIGLLGYFQSHEPFDKRKFGASVVRALTFGAIYTLGGGTDQLAAFLTGLAGDVVINRVAGRFGVGSFPLNLVGTRATVTGNSLQSAPPAAPPPSP